MNEVVIRFACNFRLDRDEHQVGAKTFLSSIDASDDMQCDLPEVIRVAFDPDDRIWFTVCMYIGTLGTRND